MSAALPGAKPQSGVDCHTFGCDILYRLSHPTCNGHRCVDFGATAVNAAQTYVESLRQIGENRLVASDGAEAFGLGCSQRHETASPPNSD